MSINIFIIDLAEARKRLKKAIPPQVREALDNSGYDVDIESAEELRNKLPKGFPSKFVVPEEVLVFPQAEGETETTKNRRRRMKELNNKLRRKRIAGMGQ